MDRQVCHLCLVGTAAGPLPGDQLRLDLRLAPRARATLTATGASIAQGSGQPARIQITACVGDGAELSADPGALIVCAGSKIDISVRLDLAESAAVLWREVIVLGRTNDAQPGSATIRWDVERVGRPVLRSRLELSDRSATRWALDGRRVLATALASSPVFDARTVVHDATAVAQRLDPHSVLLTVLDDSAAGATRRLDGLLADLNLTRPGTA
jgi:urease accessory protein